MVKKKPKIIFLHGNNGGKDIGGTAHDFWYPFAKQEFEQWGLEVIAKTFPDPKVARKSIWLPFLADSCGANEHSILIGHSSGAVAAMCFAEQQKILGSVLVGAYHTDTGDENERKSGYFDEPWNWESIRNNQQWIVQFASLDDPFFPVEEPRFVSEKLHTEYHEFADRGHFFESTFPELVEEIRKKIL